MSIKLNLQLNRFVTLTVVDSQILVDFASFIKAFHVNFVSLNYTVND